MVTNTMDIQAWQILIYHVISHHKFKPDIENTYITTILEHKVIQQGVWQSDKCSSCEYTCTIYNIIYHMEI
jgi:hypothetical protein